VKPRGYFAFSAGGAAERIYCSLGAGLWCLVLADALDAHAAAIAMASAAATAILKLEDITPISVLPGLNAKLRRAMIAR
jgi:hypothetical protein